MSAALKAKAEHKQICALMNSFVTAETAVIKFLEDNKTWCGIPDQIIAGAKANHEKSMKFRTVSAESLPDSSEFSVASIPLWLYRVSYPVTGA